MDVSTRRPRAVLLAGLLVLGGCGLAETTAVGAAGAASAAEQARQAEAQMQQVQQQIDAAHEQAAAARAAAEDVAQ